MPLELQLLEVNLLVLPIWKSAFSTGDRECELSSGTKLEEAYLLQLNLNQAIYSFVYPAKSLSVALFPFELSPLSSLQCLGFILEITGAELSYVGSFPCGFLKKTNLRHRYPCVLPAGLGIR